LVFLDHVVYVTRDLDETAAEFEQMYGLRFLPGGRHPGGTSNVVAPLEAPQYFELLAFEEGADSLTDEIEALIEGGSTLLGWGIAVDDIEVVAARLGCEAEAGSITRDDGTIGSWRIVGSDDVSLPFFVAYDDADLRVGEWQDRVRAAGNGGFGGFTFVEWGGEPASLRAWLGDSDLPVRFVSGRPGLHAVGIAGPAGEIVIRDES
jgi:hypothetical protein